jgi:hypothetical protein
MDDYRVSFEHGTLPESQTGHPYQSEEANYLQVAGEDTKTGVPRGTPPCGGQ